MTSSLLGPRSRPLPSRIGRTPLVAPSAPTPVVAPARRWQHWYSSRLRITDSVIVCAAVFLAQYIRFGDSPNTSGYPGPLMTLFSFMFAAVVAVVHCRFQQPVDPRHRGGTRRVPAHRQRIVLDIRNHRNGNAPRENLPGPRLLSGSTAGGHFRVAGRAAPCGATTLPASERRADIRPGCWRSGTAKRLPISPKN